MNQTALAFFAHPDDAEIFCGGTLWRLRERGWAIHIATATAGDCGTMTHSAKEISRIRTAEAAAAAKLIGGDYHCLHELDGRVCYTPAAVQKTVDLLRRVNPSLVFTHPRLDYMPDHEQVHLLARMGSFLFGAPNASASVPAPAGSHIPHLYYCDPLGGTDPYTGRPVVPDTVVEVSAVHEQKLRMLACHASQREWLRAHHGIDEYLDATRRHDALRGAEAGVAHAEAFTRHRGHPYPPDDLLATLFGRG